MNRLNKGFTLIEVMIVVVVIGILVAIALPNYQEHVKRGHRAEGQAFLSDAAARQERFYTQGSAYATTLTALYGKAAVTSTTDRYSLSLSSVADDGGYTLTAVPTFSDPRCGSLSLDAKGGTAITGTGDLSYCWRQNF